MYPWDTLRKFSTEFYIFLAFSAYVGEEESGLRLQLVAGGIVAIVVVLAAVIVLTVVFVRSRSNDECNKKQPSDCDTLEYRNGEGTFRRLAGYRICAQFGVDIDF